MDGNEHQLAATVCDDSGKGHARICGAHFNCVQIMIELGPRVLNNAQTRLGVVAGDLRAFDACLCIEDGLDGCFGERLWLAVGGA